LIDHVLDSFVVMRWASATTKSYKLKFTYVNYNL
jgi:hypothetical protein